jgi:hypothetical protein
MKVSKTFAEFWDEFKKETEIEYGSRNYYNLEIAWNACANAVIENIKNLPYYSDQKDYIIEIIKGMYSNYGKIETLECLKLCPCCGGRAQYSSDGGCQKFQVFCIECGLTIIDYDYRERGKEYFVVTNRWNKRI